MTRDKTAEVLAHVLECCRAHEPEVCLIGNVTAAQLTQLLENVATKAEIRVLTIVKQCCKDSPMWMRANMPELYDAEVYGRRDTDW